MTPTPADTIIDAGWIIPMAPDETTALSNTSIVITDGKIEDIHPTATVREKYTAKNHLNRPSSIILPGLINAHTHAGMTMMRGSANDQSLHNWLHKSIWPMEAVFSAKPEFCHDGTMLACAEMIRAGITCFADMYFFPEAGASAVLSTGMRAIIGLPILAFPTAYAYDEAEYTAKASATFEKLKKEPLLSFAYAPHAPYSVSPAQWSELKSLSDTTGIPIHTHLHETSEECRASLTQDRSNPACHLSTKECHPLEDLDDRGLLSPNLIATHMIHLTDDEITLCAKRKLNVTSCPTSNAKLASGFCPIVKLIDAGVNVALGTDSACSNNNLDILAEAKLAALNAKNVAGDAAAIPAAMALKMATINGACAFGIDDVTGSLEVGKAADLISIDVGTHAANSPVFNPHAAVVYAACRSDVRDVLVAGRFLLQDREYRTVDLQSVLQKAQDWQHQILDKFPTLL